MGKIRKLHQGALVGEGSSEEVYPVTAAQAVYHSNGQNLETLLNNGELLTCDTAAATAAKTASQTGFILAAGKSVKIRFTYENTASSPTLNINSTGAKAIKYNGTAASSTNSWVAGEIVEFFYNDASSGSWEGHTIDNPKVSVSQNTNTGHIDITVGSTTTPAASVLDVFDLLAKYIVVKQNQKIAGDGLCRFYQDYYVNTGGTLTGFSGSVATYYIPVKAGASYHYRNGRLQSQATIAFYDGEKNFVSSLGSFEDVEIDYDFTVPANCYYLRASILVGGVSSFYISSAQDYELEYDKFLFGWLKELQDVLLIKSGTIIQKNEDNTYKDGYYLNVYGGESYFGSPYKFTENYIPVFGNVHYLYEGSISGGASICFYDKDKNLISSICPDSETWTEHEFITPATCCYIRCTTMSTCNIYLSEDIIGNKITQWVISLLEQHGILYQSNSLIAPDSENTYKNGYYLNPLGGESYFGSPYKCTENYIFVIPNSKYKYSGLVNSQASIVFYDINKNYIGSIYPDSETWYEHEFTTPANCLYIRCTTMSTVDIYCVDEMMGSSFDKEIHNVVSAIGEHNNIGTLNYGESLVGDVDITNIKKYDYAHIIYYGQSLSCGVDTPSALTTTPISGCYMIGDSLEDFGSGTTKNPLVNTQREHPVVATVNAFARLYRQFVEPQKDFFGSSCGIGGATITELSKGGTLYDNRFINQIDRIQNCVSGEGKTIACPAIVYLQGENDVNPGFTPKDTYKALMLQLKNDMQADIMAKYGQTEKPMFFIYSVSNQFNSQPSMNIPMAQIEFAAENEDVFLLNPYYAMPSYDRYHMSKNGYRWYGSLAAKSIFDVIVKCRDYSTIIPKTFELLSKKELLVRFYVPVEPLVFDSAIIPDAGNNYGFALFLNSARIDLNKIELYDSNSIKITTYEDIDSGTLEIYYAMAGSIGWGTGNLRDSDAFKAYYNYIDDTGEESANNTDMYYHPTQLYGKKYPLYNWCSPFYYLIRS